MTSTTPTSSSGGLTMRDRVVATITGRPTDRPPFVDRLQLWYTGMVRTGRLPPEFAELSLNQIHRQVGIGRQLFASCYGQRLRGVEMIATFEGETVFHETDPIVSRFPDIDLAVPSDRPGVTQTRLITPVGELTVEHTMIEHMIASGTREYTSKHPITREEDFAVAEYILERREFVPQFDYYRRQEAEIGDFGYAIPMLERIPFLQLMIDYFSTDSFFFALYDNPKPLQRLMDLLDQSVTESLGRLADLDVPYVQFGDNLDGMMVGPQLFQTHCLPYYQRYTERLHGQGKKVGSHTDGHLRPILHLIPETGLDVCESIAAAPLTDYPFSQVWAAWERGPIVWGGIPSPILEDRTPRAEFERHMQELLNLVGDSPIIFGVSDMVLPNNDIHRVRAVAEMLYGS